MSVRMFQPRQAATFAELSAVAGSAATGSPAASNEQIRTKMHDLKTRFDGVILAQNSGDRKQAAALQTAAFATLGETEAFCSEQVKTAEQTNDLGLLERLMPLVNRCQNLRGDMRFFHAG